MSIGIIRQILYKIFVYFAGFLTVRPPALLNWKPQSIKTTLFVGANNSGKTSAMDALAKLLANRSFVFNDITISRRTEINKIGSKWAESDCQQPNDLLDWDKLNRTVYCIAL